MIVLNPVDMGDAREVEVFDDDIIVGVLNNLRWVSLNLFLLSDFSRNAPCPSKEPRPAKKRRIQKARPKRLPEISHEFLVNPPYRYVIMANGDPRISLGYEFMDAYVSGSAEIFTEMMNRKCDPNIVFMQHYDGRQNPYGPNERKIIGLRNVTDFWLTCMSSAPDIIPTIYETPTGFRNDSTEESFVSVKTLNSMTKTGLVMDRQQLKALNAKEAIDVQGTYDQFTQRLLFDYCVFCRHRIKVWVQACSSA